MESNYPGKSQCKLSKFGTFGMYLNSYSPLVGEFTQNTNITKVIDLLYVLGVPRSLPCVFQDKDESQIPERFQGTEVPLIPNHP